MANKYVAVCLNTVCSIFISSTVYVRTRSGRNTFIIARSLMALIVLAISTGNKKMNPISFIHYVLD